MTNEEALKRTKEALMHGRISSDMEDFAYLVTVYAALKKQTHKKPVGLSCPVCGYTVAGEWNTYPYCHHCGQAILWTEDEE